LEPTAPGIALQTTRGRTHRLWLGHRRQLLDSRRGRGEKTGPHQTDRRRAGRKHHLHTDAQGIPLSVVLTEANRNDVTQLLPLLDAMPSIAGQRGAPIRKPKLVQADRGYDSNPLRKLLAGRGIQSQIARRYTKHG